MRTVVFLVRQGLGFRGNLTMKGNPSYLVHLTDLVVKGLLSLPLCRW